MIRLESQMHSDHFAHPFVAMSVVRTLSIAVTMLVSMALLSTTGACKKGDKSKTTPKGSSGTVTTEDTKMMGDGSALPDANGGDSADETANGDQSSGKATDGDDAKGDGKDTSETGAPTIEPPDLDIGAAAQAQTVAKHLEAARVALSGDKKDPDQALREARAVLVADAANIDAVVAMAHAYYHKRLYDTAEVMLEMLFKSRKTAKSHAGAYYVYGLIYDSTNRPELAMAAYEKAVEFKPDYQSALINLGVHRLHNHAFPEAIKIYEKLINEQGLKNAITWTNLGSSYRGHSGDYPLDSSKRVDYLRKAETAYKRAINEKRSYGNVYYDLGLLYLDADPFPMPDGTSMDRLKRLERAKTYFEEYRSMGGANIDLVDERLKQVNKLIKRETKKRQREEDKKKKKTTTKKKSGDDDW